jgi:hypothetical protein
VSVGVFGYGGGCACSLVVIHITLFLLALQTTYAMAIETLQQVGKVVESLYAKTVKIG